MENGTLTLRKPGKNELPSGWQVFGEILLRRRKIIYTVVSSCMMATLLYCLWVKNEYTSTATILPTSGTDEMSAFRDLAAGSLASLGLGSTAVSSENSSTLYPKVLTSRLVSDRILETTFNTYGDADYEGKTLEEYLHERNRDKALQELQTFIAIEVDRRTGVIDFSVTTPCRELSAEMVHAYLAALNDYNVNQRRSVAAENEHFIAARQEELEQELASAEEELRQFRLNNRDFVSGRDPDLLLEQARLERKVQLKSTLFVALSAEHQRARVAAARDVPIVQILDQGEVSIEKSAPSRTAYLLVALLGSLFVAIVLVLWLELADRRELKVSLRRLAATEDLHLSRLEHRVLARLLRGRGEHSTDPITKVEPKTAARRGETGDTLADK